MSFLCNADSRKSIPMLSGVMVTLEGAGPTPLAAPLRDHVV